MLINKEQLYLFLCFLNEDFSLNFGFHEFLKMFQIHYSCVFVMYVIALSPLIVFYIYERENKESNMIKSKKVTVINDISNS